MRHSCSIALPVTGSNQGFLPPSSPTEICVEILLTVTMGAEMPKFKPWSSKYAGLSLQVSTLNTSSTILITLAQPVVGTRNFGNRSGALAAGKEILVTLGAA